ncbi:unnamed protein product [Linum trigynum]|uniref:Uncharacterized protein n=1 Tax=Linum trigynum TaxID=586398 RepID=A0AAV2GMR4_9ROSI
MVLIIRVRFGKQDTAGAGESVQSPGTKRQRIDSRKDCGPPQRMNASKKEKKKMQKQTPIAAAREIQEAD